MAYFVSESEFGYGLYVLTISTFIISMQLYSKFVSHKNHQFTNHQFTVLSVKDIFFFSSSFKQGAKCNSKQVDIDIAPMKYELSDVEGVVASVNVQFVCSFFSLFD